MDGIKDTLVSGTVVKDMVADYEVSGLLKEAWTVCSKIINTLTSSLVPSKVIRACKFIEYPDGFSKYVSEHTKSTQIAVPELEYDSRFLFGRPPRLPEVRDKVLEFAKDIPGGWSAGNIKHAPRAFVYQPTEIVTRPLKTSYYNFQFGKIEDPWNKIHDFYSVHFGQVHDTTDDATRISLANEMDIELIPNSKLRLSALSKGVKGSYLVPTVMLELPLHYLVQLYSCSVRWLSAMVRLVTRQSMYPSRY
jgi:hypothetical protein